MKITRKQLRTLIEASLEISDAEVAAAKQKLEDEGGAAGADLVAQAMRDADEGDTDVDDDNKYIEKLLEKDPSIKVHPNGDVIDTSGLDEAIISMIREAMSDEEKRRRLAALKAARAKASQVDTGEDLPEEPDDALAAMSAGADQIMRDLAGPMSDEESDRAEKIARLKAQRRERTRMTNQLINKKKRTGRFFENKRVTRSILRKIILEELAKLPSYAYYDYGIDHVPNKTNAHEDIIGHT